MAEGTLSLEYADLRKSIGHFLGYKRDSTAWSQEQIDDIEEVLQAGLRQFYYPPEPFQHEWTFLRPVTTLATIANTWEYNAPDSFGQVDGDFTYAPNTAAPKTINVIGESQIRQLRQASDVKGFPQYVAVRPKTSDLTDGQRFQFIFWPTPNAVWTLTYRYLATNNKITSTNKYPLGGQLHSATIEQSCRAVAELRMNNKRGTEWEQFQAMLAGSVKRDQAAIGAEFLGYNGDSSDSQHRCCLPDIRKCTVKGVMPT